MKKYIFFLFLVFLSNPIISAQQIFKGFFKNKSNGITLTLDLYKETVSVPSFSFLGGTNGYMSGNIYGIWIVTKSQIGGKKATIHLSNEFGSESQTITFEQLTDSTYQYEAQGSPIIKKISNKKLVKIPTKMIFELIENKTKN